MASFSLLTKPLYRIIWAISIAKTGKYGWFLGITTKLRYEMQDI
jgi:hypothetical protein